MTTIVQLLTQSYKTAEFLGQRHRMERTLVKSTQHQLPLLPPRGAFIVFEGCDRSGKSTQTHILAEYLKSQGRKVQVIRFPNRQSKSGQLIDKYLKGEEKLTHNYVHLLFSANRWEMQRQMEELLKQGTTLIADRYSYSGIAYSVANGLNFEWCRSTERGLLQPDLIVYIRPFDLEAIARRSAFGAEIYEKMEFQEKVLKNYDYIFGSVFEDNILTVDANNKIISISNSIISRVEKLLHKVCVPNCNVLYIQD